MSKIILIALKFIAIVLLFLTLFSAVVMWLWNWLIPDIFNGPRISLLQAAGLLILCKILFGGFQKTGDHLTHHKKKYWRKKFEEKVSHMSPDAKEKLKNYFKNCGEEGFWNKGDEDDS